MKKIISMIKLTMLIALTSNVYAQDSLRLVNIDIENNEVQNTISATGSNIFSYNQKMAFLLATELKETKNNVNIIGMKGIEDSYSKALTSNQVNPDILISLGFDALPIQELKYWDYEGQKLGYSDDIKGFSIFVNANHKNIRETLVCARQVSDTIQKIGFQPNWSNNKKYKLIFPDMPIYNMENNKLINNSKSPVMKIVPGVLTHRKESQSFDSENTNLAFIKAITMGLNNCFNNVNN